MRPGWKPIHDPPMFLYRALSRRSGLPWLSFLPRLHNPHRRWPLRLQGKREHRQRTYSWRYE
jgi:hypothetical protein